MHTLTLRRGGQELLHLSSYPLRCGDESVSMQVMERWIQAAPMHALLRQPRVPTYSTEGEAHAARGDADDDDATVDPTTDCIVSAVLEMAFAGVALLLPEADAKGRRIFSLAYEDPPARECRLSLGAHARVCHPHAPS